MNDTELAKQILALNEKTLRTRYEDFESVMCLCHHMMLDTDNKDIRDIVHDLAWGKYLAVKNKSAEPAEQTKLYRENY